MKFKFISLCLFIGVLAILTSCGDKGEEQAPGNAADLEGYQAHLNEVFSESDHLLSVYSTALDGLYTGEVSEEQFSTLLRKEVISQSNELVSLVESYNASPTIFELNQQLATFANNQHQLFLDSIDMANEERMNKTTLRDNLIKIKDEQASFINAWKVL
ncbi:hypothetical protein [Halobacillus litoralis]|uniref:Lipoprotein n=1 Tax=Halobacillus litoralis TaxID=45668 RepID=A0A410MJA0_9BACI|nr:hypothetical protein [Halobacillus litoralis]QAS54756.1 hypothetical protein HLI_21095 [Halobacillus litoralis]